MNISFETGLVAILRTKTESDSRDMANALVNAGITLIEFTMTTPGALNLVEEFSANKSINVGLGTVLTTEHVKAGKKVGAQFIISPHTDEEVIKATKAADLISIPGVASPTLRDDSPPIPSTQGIACSASPVGRCASKRVDE